MRHPTTTPTQVAEAAAAIAGEGKTPSIRTVIARIGGGSPNHVGPLLKEWVLCQTPKLVPVFLDMAVVEAIVLQIRTVAAATSADKDVKLRVAEDNAALLSNSCTDLESHLRDQQTALDTMGDRLQHQDGQLEERQRELEALRTDSTASAERSRSALAAERAVTEDLRQQLVSASLRLESLPRLEHALEESELLLQATTDDSMKARESAAVALAQIQDLARRVVELSGREGSLQKELVGSKSELTKAWEGERFLRVEMQKLVGQLAAAQGQCALLGARLSNRNRDVGRGRPPQVSRGLVPPTPIKSGLDSSN